MIARIDIKTVVDGTLIEQKETQFDFYGVVTKQINSVMETKDERIRMALIRMGWMPPEQLEEIARAIHYPECWDTVNYPTLFSALMEQFCNPDCCIYKE